VTAASEFERALKIFAGEVNNNAKKVLGRRTIGKNKTYGEASGKLRKSLAFKVTKSGKQTQIKFGSPLKYAAFIHWGVNGTSRNRGAPYSYSNKQPPTSAILKWMKLKPVRLRDASGKFVRQTDSAMNSAAFNIARSIKRNGIAGLKYYEKAYLETLPKATAKLGEAFVKDLSARLFADVGNYKNITIK
tara:strand:+ start:497 stop:1063 length:567 start_codon:yes stop_codon:yes gene_type:complete